MNIRITILYCERTISFSTAPSMTLADIIKNAIESGYAKQQMLVNPGVYSPEKNALFQGIELNKKLEQIFPIVNIQGPPVELLVLRKEEFDQYEVAIKSQPQLQDDCFPPDSTNNLVPQQQPSVDALSPMSTQHLVQQQPSVDDLMPQSTQQLMPQTQLVSSSSSQNDNLILQIETSEGLQKKKFDLKVNENYTPNDVKERLFERFGFGDRSIVDLNLYYGQLLLVGQKAIKTLYQLSIPSGSLITVKARWTGGNRQ